MTANVQYYGDRKSVFHKFTEASLLHIINHNIINEPIKIKQFTDVIVLHVSGNISEQIYQIKKTKEHIANTPILLVVLGEQAYLNLYIQYGANDAFYENASISQIECRIQFIIKHPTSKKLVNINRDKTFKLPLWKRLFDIAFASIALIFLTPIFAIIALLIRLESKGPVFYASKRVGSGYKVFDFYKFRSMYKDADKRIKELMNESQYMTESVINNSTVNISKTNSTVLIHDEGVISETEMLQKKKAEEERAFFKLTNDPRITRVGKFIRNTSIDELPQFINVLKGDMSIVGNRPLPLYEAEKLTTDNCAQRYLAPAGLTGLWQVNQRAKSNNMSASERKMLDVTYAKNYTFFSDLMIILKTLPAMIQHESV